MSSTTAREPRNDKKRTDESILETDAQFIQGLKVFSGDSESVSGLAGGNAQNSPSAPAGNYLAREGDSMIGPIAYGPPVNFRVQIGTEENINISNLGDSPQYSSNIELDAIQPNGFVLDRIDGAAFDGQILIIRTFGPDSFTISQATMANGGNIQTPSDEDFELGALQMIYLVFDEALVVFGNTGGTWRVLSSAGGGGTTGTYISCDMDQNQTSNLNTNDHVQFNQIIEDGGIVLQGQTPTFDQTSGIFELKAGKTYYLSAYLNVQFNNNMDATAFQWWDITNGVSLSQSLIAQPTEATNLNTITMTTETIFTPVTDVTVELRIINVIGSITNITEPGSQANIFEFSGKNGPAGPPGPAGSGLTWKLPARAKTLVNVPDLNNFDVLTDGVTLVEDDRVLLTEQTTLSENGLWQVGAVAAGIAPLTRPTDFDTDAEVLAETFVAIEEGDNSKDTLWHLISNNPLTIDVSDQVWEVFAPGNSGGPDLGGGQDGIDGAGQFVNDGRVAIGGDLMRRWEQVSNFIYPNNFIRDMIYLPSIFANPIVNGRLVMCGGSQGAAPNDRGATYSDNYGGSWIGTIGTSNQYTYNRMAYDPAASVLVMVSDLGPPVPNQLQTVRRSLDRGANWSNTAITSGTTLFRDVVWSVADSQFVMVAANNPTNAIWTSPDGNVWTQRVNAAPASNPLASWIRIEYSPSLGLYLATSNSGFDVMTSPDGITWTVFDITTTTPATLGGNGQRRLVWSEGQSKFVTVNAFGVVSISPDGINWTQNTVPGAPNLKDVRWSPNLSLWLVMIDQFTGEQIFRVSNDAETWAVFPENTMRSNLGTLFGTQFNKGAIAIADEWNYFFACGGGPQSGVGTSNGVLWRTQVTFNNQFTA